MAAKLFGLDNTTVREILKLHALDGATPRRVKKLFGLDGSTVRLIFEDFASFAAAGAANLINSPVNEVVDFGVRDDFNAGGADVSVNASASGDASNVGSVSGLSIDVDSSHTYSSTVAAAVSSGSGGNLGVAIADDRFPSQSIGYDFPGFNSNPDGYNGQTYVASALAGNYPSGGSNSVWGSNIQNYVFRGNISSNLGNPIGSSSSSNNGSGFFAGLAFKTINEAGVQNQPRQNQTITVQGEKFLCSVARTSTNVYWTWGGNPYNQISARADWNIFYYSYYGTRATRVQHARNSNLSNVGIVNISGRLYTPGYNVTGNATGRRARVQNGTNRNFFISGGGLTAGGNFPTGNLAAGASSSFITANSTNEAWTLTGTAQKNPATFSIANNDGNISVSGTFADGENATQARDRIQAALNANGTFQSKFNTGTDTNKTVGGVGHKVVRFTSDAAENTSDFSMTITQNDGSNTTPHEETVTQGELESLQTQVQVTRAVEGSQVSSTKAISSQANTDTAGAEVATLGGDITYDSSTNKLKVQDRDATISITNAGSLSFTKE